MGVSTRKAAAREAIRLRWDSPEQADYLVQPACSTSGGGQHYCATFPPVPTEHKQEPPVTDAAMTPTDGRPGEASRPPGITDQQLSIAEDIASGSGLGHDESCDVWSEDPDGCSCELRYAIAVGLQGSRIVDLTQELGWDFTTKRGDRTIRLDFNPMPAVPDRSPAPEVVVEAIARALHGLGIEGWRQVIRDDVTEPTRAQRKLAADLVAALPAQREPTTPELDEERLARALTEHFGPSYFPGQHDVTIFGSSPHDVAEQIAAAYRDSPADAEGEPR